MDRWSNRVAVVTGASVGIGASIVVELTKAGMIVVGLARRAEKVEELRSQVPGNLRKNLHALKCDVSNEQEIVATFNEIDKKFGGVSVLVNNAGIICEGSLLDQGNAEKLRSVIDVNIFGLVFCTREAYRLMKKHKIDDGHIVHINSIAGHKVPAISQEFGEDLNFNIYSPSKHAVTALTQVYRNDLMNAGTKIKVTSLSPGLVLTDIFINEGQRKMVSTLPGLVPLDIANGVLYVLGTPPHVNIPELTITPVGERF